MIKLQVQIPDELYYRAKTIAAQRDWSLDEVVRRGLEPMARTFLLDTPAVDWQLPVLNADSFVPNFDQLDLRASSGREEILDAE